MKVSIITPSYNQGNFLERTIKSVLSQDYEDLEYIIIDGGSNDNSVEIIKKYEKHLSYWVSEKDNGQSHAFNKGLEKATGDIIGWLNSDDIYYPNAIKECIEILKSKPDTDIIFSDYNFIDEYDNIIRTRKELPFNYEMYLWAKGCYHANCAGFFKKSCFNKYGNLKEDIQFGMDYELYLRFGRNGCKFHHSKSIWGGYRFHSNSKSISSYNKQLADVENISRSYMDLMKINKAYSMILPTYYRSKRIIKKLFNRSYF